MQQMVDIIVNIVMEAITKMGLVQVEVSARHVHLSEKDVEILFGPSAKLTPKRELSQPGQFLAEERVTIMGPKGKKERVAVLGPARKNTQIELSKSDCVELGIDAPIRESGDVEGSGSIIIKGLCGTIDAKEGTIIAHNHIHITPKEAKDLGLKDKERVYVEILSDRPVIFKDVIVRVNSDYRFKMHIDFDEANASGVSGFVLGKIKKVI